MPATDATYLGVEVEDATVTGLKGVLITDQKQNPGNSPLGLLANDIIIAVDIPLGLGGPLQFNVVGSVSDLRRVLAKVPIGQQVAVEVYRPAYGPDGRPVRGVILDGLPLTPALDPETGAVPTFLGVHLADHGGLGVRVVRIAGEVASEIALQADDIITAINGTSVASIDALRAILATFEPGATVTIRYDRGATTGQTITLSVGPAAGRDLPLEGLTVQELTADLARARGYDRTSGARIRGLLFDTPALTSSLTTGDVIVGLQTLDEATEVAVTGAAQLAAEVAARAGRTVSIRVIRGSTPRSPITVTLLSEPVSSRVAPNIGMAIAPRPVGQPEGVQATGIYRGGPADVAGIAEGDLITALNGVTVNTPEEFWTRIKGLFSGQDVRVEVRTVTSGRVQFRSLLLTSAALPAGG